jgi:hypothetical protein
MTKIGKMSGRLDLPLVVSYGELQVTWYDMVLLATVGCVTSKFGNLDSMVLEDGSEVD